MEKLQLLLQVSAKLYQHLTNIPLEKERDSYIETIHMLLDERGQIIKELEYDGFKVNLTEKSHQILVKLDKGIKERLDKVLNLIKHDLKDLQNAKKNEKQYLNPYANVQVMDGRYYDKKN